ncbi:hypothetical protein V8F33_002326 [Rhypophila sp. PSN 637]
MATAQDLAASGVVVGVKALTGKVQPRVDIDVLLTEKPDTFNLMLQALAAMQNNPDLLGFYSIAGIHGFPTTTWDSVLSRFNSAGARFGGYCPHGRIIFPTWHRPYLLLIEQTIYQNMVEIAAKYDPPHRDRYLKAANEFRLPYLDYFRARDDRGVKMPGPGEDKWSKYDFRLPDVLNEPRINVKLPPLDNIEEIDNPLYTYKFKDNRNLPQDDWDQVNTPGQSPQFSTSQTLRWPTSATQTEHGLEALSISLNQARAGGITTFFDLISTAPYATLEAVASDRLVRGDMTTFRKLNEDNQVIGSGSIEGFHGNYHIFIGGNSGHMSVVPIAAFDPVFWLHHAQVDRVWSLWQAFHPDVWFPPAKKAGQQADNEKDLLPFYLQRDGPGKGKFYNSDDTKSTEDLGYVYDDFVGLGEKKDELLGRLKGKYDWQRVKPDDPSITDPNNAMKPLYTQIHGSYFLANLKSSKTLTPAVPAPTITRRRKRPLQSLVAQSAAAKIDPIFDREWYVDTTVLRSAANGPFTIYFFLAPQGEVTSEGASLAQSPFLAGINHMFVASAEACDNCGDLEALRQMSSETTPITPLLLTYLELEDNELESLRPEHVKPFLVKYLRWRVVFNGSEIQDPRVLAQSAHLKIGVSAKVYHDDGTKTYEEYPDVVEQIKANASAVAGV